MLPSVLAWRPYKYLLAEARDTVKRGAAVVGAGAEEIAISTELRGARAAEWLAKADQVYLLAAGRARHGPQHGAALRRAAAPGDRAAVGAAVKP